MPPRFYHSGGQGLKPSTGGHRGGREGTLAPPMAFPPEISAVVPAYDERENLPLLVEELRAALDGTGQRYEMVLVDDGSRDGSAEWLQAAARQDPRLVPVLLERNVGQSAALAAGLARARGAVIITLDADLQNDPAELPALLAALGNADVVSGVRRRRQDRWLRRVSSRIANAVRRAWLGDPVTDIGCSFKAYRREALECLPWFVGAHRFLPALCVFRGARYAEVPLSHRPRLHGRSKYGVSNRLWRGLADLFGVRWLKSRLVRYRIREVTR
jgi:dolichol-phosphate mannosyltransferase